MPIKQVPFSQVTQQVWDQWAENIPGATYHHSWYWLNCVEKLAEVRLNASFALMEETVHGDRLIALCPLGVSYLEREGITTLSFGYFGCAAPALISLPPSAHRKTLDSIFEIIVQLAKKHNAGKISMLGYPITTTMLASSTAATQGENSFELMRYNFLPIIENTAIVDLRLPEDVLRSNVSKYHYRHIARTEKHAVRIQIYNNKSNANDLKVRFAEFQSAHLQAAGKVTRPQATWDAMYDSAAAGHATFFVAFLGSTPISFLYCGEFKTMAFGWSQVNVKSYEEEYSPRHLLEWEAMRYYKQNGFAFYEIGERYFGPQLMRVPSAKELSISIFKERYGGFLMPKIFWEGWLDAAAQSSWLDEHITAYKKADSLVRLPI